MTPQLRKRHLQIWVILALALPIGFFSAFLVVPPPAGFGDGIPNPQPVALTDLDRTADFPELTLSLRSEKRSILQEGLEHELPQMEDTDFQLEINLKQAFRAPSVLVYLSLEPDSESVEGKLLVGRLSSAGTYRFNLDQIPAPPDTVYLILYDDIHRQILHQYSL